MWYICVFHSNVDRARLCEFVSLLTGSYCCTAVPLVDNITISIFCSIKYTFSPFYPMLQNHSSKCVFDFNGQGRAVCACRSKSLMLHTLICGCWNEANLSASKITVYRICARAWRVEISYVCSIVAQRPGDGELDCVSAWCRCTGRDQTSILVYTIFTFTPSSV